jgi:hypothetical protein
MNSASVLYMETNVSHIKLQTYSFRILHLFHEELLERDEHFAISYPMAYVGGGTGPNLAGYGNDELFKVWLL